MLPRRDNSNFSLRNKFSIALLLLKFVFNQKNERSEINKKKKQNNPMHKTKPKQEVLL